MDFQFNTDNIVDGTQGLADKAEARVRHTLRHVTRRLTRVEVHIRDVDGLNNRPDGIEARIEARPRNGDPLGASARGGDPMQALSAALDSLSAKLSSHLGKADRVRW